MTLSNPTTETSLPHANLTFEEISWTNFERFRTNQASCSSSATHDESVRRSRPAAKPFIKRTPPRRLSRSRFSRHRGALSSKRLRAVSAGDKCVVPEQCKTEPNKICSLAFTFTVTKNVSCLTWVNDLGQENAKLHSQREDPSVVFLRVRPDLCPSVGRGET